MYQELYESWKRELENNELEKLESKFYWRIAQYLTKIREEGRMLDKKTVKARLIKKEMRNVKRMVHDLIWTRYRKIVEKAVSGERTHSENLTIEEKQMQEGILPLAEAYQNLTQRIMRGGSPILRVERKNKRAVVRFLKEVPAIVGADMETYGPFEAEDVASLPIENSKVLVKQGLAERIEV